MKIDQLLKQEWHIQGFIASPLYIVPCGCSGIMMKDYFGFGFNYFLYFFRNDYVEMHYNVNDLKRIWFELEKKIKKDSDYLGKVRKDYISMMHSFKLLMDHIDAIDLKRISNKDLFSLLQKVINMDMESVKIGHIIEPFSLVNDRKLRHIIRDSTDDPKNIGRYFGLLSHPVKNSWTNDSEFELYKISKVKDKKRRETQLKAHAKKYFWVKNNYLDAKPFGVKEFADELKDVKDYKPLDYGKIKKDKLLLIKELNFDKDTVEMIHQIEFFMDFQDERKKYILQSLHYLEMLCRELTVRFKIEGNLVKYLLPEDINEEFLGSKDLKNVLRKRREGCLIVSSESGNIIITGAELSKLMHKLESRPDVETSDLYGFCASAGTAVGRAVICKSIASINNVMDGDIIVASMTRPEYTSAMKKSAGIVTDEGGITCHAAIVSRELGLPCVIGTKIATKVIRDGDLIEVRANHGIVKILERKH